MTPTLLACPSLPRFEARRLRLFVVSPDGLCRETKRTQQTIHSQDRQDKGLTAAPAGVELGRPQAPTPMFPPLSGGGGAKLGSL
jgi:hypothetical protein